MKQSEFIGKMTDIYWHLRKLRDEQNDFDRHELQELMDFCDELVIFADNDSGIILEPSEEEE